MKTWLYFIGLLVITLSCDDIIEVEDISNRNVDILAPTNGSIINQTTTTFTWNPVEDADAYRLQIATPNFENASQIVLDSTIVSNTLTKALISGDYEWRIRAENLNYQTPYTYNSFTIAP